jgi:uncharacterized protein
MDQSFEDRGNSFVWDEAKAVANMHKHGITFEEAATVFSDPVFKLQDASRNDEGREAAIGFSARGRLLMVVHVEVGADNIRIISARRATVAEELFYDQ